MNSAFMFGNALADGVRGWFVGQFVSELGGLRKRDDVELKWGVHPKGEHRPGAWVEYRTATTIAVLIEGQCLIKVRAGKIASERLLSIPGDYLIMTPGTEHTWVAITDCVVLTIRAPSVSDDLIERKQ